MAGKPAGKATIRVAGAKELQRAFGTMSRRAGNLNANKRAAQIVSDTAYRKVPRRTGRLSRTIKPLSSRNKSIVEAGGGLPPYAGPIHFGWQAHNINAQPFLYDALDENRGKINELYVAEIGSLVVKVGQTT